MFLRNEKEILPFDRSKVRSIAVLGRLAPGIPATGFGSSFLDAIRSISELSGIKASWRVRPLKSTSLPPGLRIQPRRPGNS